MSVRYMLDTALEGGRLARKSTGGETDPMRAGGVLDPDGRDGRYLRLRGWVVSPTDPAGIGADVLGQRLEQHGLIPHGSSTDDAVAEYVRLARLAELEASGTAQRRQIAAEARHDQDMAEAEADRQIVRDRLTGWLGRLVCPDKWAYCAALVDMWETGGPEPAMPSNGWAPKARARYDYLVTR